MKTRCAALLLLAATLLSACRPMGHGPSTSPIVRQIVATEEGSDYFLRRYYDTGEKMQAILIALRALRPKFDADVDVQALRKPTLCLTLRCSDGSEQLYRLKGNFYLQIGTGPWKKVDSGRAGELWRLLWEMESDPETPRTFHTPLPRLRGNWTYPYGHRKFP